MVKAGYKKCIMCVTADKYELPIFIADSLKEASMLSGISQSNICKFLYQYENKVRHGTRNGLKFVHVYIEEK